MAVAALVDRNVRPALPCMDAGYDGWVNRVLRGQCSLRTHLVAEPRFDIDHSRVGKFGQRTGFPTLANTVRIRAENVSALVNAVGLIDVVICEKQVSPPRVENPPHLISSDVVISCANRVIASMKNPQSRGNCLSRRLFPRNSMGGKIFPITAKHPVPIFVARPCTPSPAAVLTDDCGAESLKEGVARQEFVGPKVVFDVSLSDARKLTATTGAACRLVWHRKLPLSVSRSGLPASSAAPSILPEMQS